MLFQKAAARCYVAVGILRQFLGMPQQVRQARLPAVPPGPVDCKIVGNQPALPVVYELLKGFPGTAGMYHEEGSHGGNHDPQPLESLLPGAEHAPVSFVDVGERHAPACLRPCVPVRPDGFADPVENVLDPSLGQRELVDSAEAPLDEAPGASHADGHFAHQRLQPCSKRAGISWRHLSRHPLAAVRAPAGQHMEVDDVQRLVGKLCALVDVLFPEGGEVMASASGACVRGDASVLRGFETPPGLSLVVRLSGPCAASAAPAAPAAGPFPVGRVRRRGTAGVAGIGVLRGLRLGKGLAQVPVLLLQPAVFSIGLGKGLLQGVDGSVGRVQHELQILQRLLDERGKDGHHLGLPHKGGQHGGRKHDPQGRQYGLLAFHWEKLCHGFEKVSREFRHKT